MGDTRKIKAPTPLAHTQNTLLLSSNTHMQKYKVMGKLCDMTRIDLKFAGASGEKFDSCNQTYRNKWE